MKHYKDKVLVTSYLEGVQGDLEMRLEMHKGTFVMEESIEERRKVIENHVKILKITKDFLHELWNDYYKLVRESNENLPL